MPDDKMPEHKWYVIHTYSGYENKVKANLEKIIDNRNLHDFISEVAVPMEEVVETKNGRRRTSVRKVFPGYVLVKMIMNDDMWGIVRNTRGVTSFVGPGSKPTPLTDKEMKFMGIKTDENINIEPKSRVKIISGPFNGSVGIVREVNKSKRLIVVVLSVFGRETPIEFDFSQIEKL